MAAVVWICMAVCSNSASGLDKASSMVDVHNDMSSDQLQPLCNLLEYLSSTMTHQVFSSDCDQPRQPSAELFRSELDNMSSSRKSPVQLNQPTLLQNALEVLMRSSLVNLSQTIARIAEFATRQHSQTRPQHQFNYNAWIHDKMHDVTAKDAKRGSFCAVSAENSRSMSALAAKNQVLGDQQLAQTQQGLSDFQVNSLIRSATERGCEWVVKNHLNDREILEQLICSAQVTRCWLNKLVAANN